jgi:hypothetical protein
MVHYHDTVTGVIDEWQPSAALQQAWKALDILTARALDLRRLSELEPLRKARPDYPRTGVARSHDDELRGVLADLTAALADVIRLLPTVLPDGAGPGVAAEETPEALARRLGALQKLAADLGREAFEPPPPLPPHAPPYLVTIPGHDLPGSKALLLSNGLLEAAAAFRNAMIAAANASSSP